MIEQSHTSSEHEHSKHQDHRLHYLVLGTALVTGAIILAPSVLPALGINNAENIQELAGLLTHHSAGWASKINTGLSAIPFIGGTLATGGFATAACVAAIGIGGVLLGRYLEKRHDGKQAINWGKVIKYGAMISSALIALPTLLSSITVGITIIADTLSPAGSLLAENTGKFLAENLGVLSTHHAAGGLTGLASIIPHFITCGLPLAPALMSLFMSDDSKEASPIKNGNTPDPSTTQLMCSKYTDGSVTTEMITDGKLEAGKPVNAKLVLRYRDGSPISAAELAVVHTEKLHLFVADSSLKDYHHIHPQPTGEPGVLAFSFTPKTANNYIAWADFTMIKDGQNHKLRSEMPSASGRKIPPSISVNTSAEKSGLRFDWQSDPLQKDAATIVKVNVTDANGNPASDLDLVMGAYAHLVGFSADGKSIIHTHPLDAQPGSTSDRGGPTLRFRVEPDCAGATQFYLQVRRNGEDIYVPFGQQIKLPGLAMERAASPHVAMGNSM